LLKTTHSSTGTTGSGCCLRVLVIVHSIACSFCTRTVSCALLLSATTAPSLRQTIWVS
jgi:hypothetical protein